MNIQALKKEEGLQIVRVSGRIDPLTSPELEEELNKLISAGTSRMILNLSEVKFISSTGLRVFLTVLKKIKARNGDIKLCAMPPSIQNIFQIAGFDTLFEILPTEEEAIRKSS